jgi:hypothetical protein
MPDAETTDADTGNQAGEEKAENLNESGVKALEAFKARARAAEKEAKRAQALEAELQSYKDRDKSETERAIEKARKEGEDATRSEITATMNRRIVRAEVKAVAGGLLADPEDAVRLLDLDEFSVDDDGNVDVAVIKKALVNLVTEKPYLAANGQRPQGSADPGARARPPVSKVDDSPRGLISAGLTANEAARARR